MQAKFQRADIFGLDCIAGAQKDINSSHFICLFFATPPADSALHKFEQTDREANWTGENF
jgi:hypothetical protein